ncbi:hypothetical protein CJO91_13055 [Ralstonia solanacearum]|uniref:hypothetical protein n=1 Tax=Ralstonia pseudosolanacearum TaxID=1310165 RepID=UPI00035B8B61|nr:hypothetical protein [Ralstonia pseudosolanacearum]AXW48538.1 hypothetical protein CJO91_13055 [Ralstonia solanacearum]ESS50150.1 hypothetical protein L665_01223 [Ralstonia solanacearum SD54]BCL86258.1 hypothetical protein MAFF211471_13410 [Ralstonia solanacearum]BCM98807.1 hypothetical protein RPSA_13440 [Ralstonia solanacearum]BEU51122.1 hypothetical protein MAFF211520_14140 [Ralstonia pseudosolanacearum]
MRTRPPITLEAANARILTLFPDCADELWSADIKACRHGVMCEVFVGILFVLHLIARGRSVLKPLML